MEQEWYFLKKGDFEQEGVIKKQTGQMQQSLDQNKALFQYASLPDISF